MLSKILLIALGYMAVSSGLTNLTTCQDQQGFKYTASFAQVTSANQDAWVKKEDKDGKLIWQKYYDQSPVDSKGILCFVDDANQLWAVFTVDGGSYDAGYITKLWIETAAFSNVIAGSYGSGGGPVATVIAKLCREDGKITKATFLSSILSSGNTNTLKVTYFGTEKAGADANLVVYGDAASNPVTTGNKLVRDSTLTDADRVDGSFKVRYELSRGLDQILAADGRFRGKMVFDTGFSSSNTCLMLAFTTIFTAYLLVF